MPMSPSEPLRVYTAKSIITQNPSMPRAEAVAVRDGQIVEVGTLKSLEPWLRQHSHEIDRRFEHAVLTPGFIDPHLHPSMAAILLPMTFITPTQWRLPWATVPASDSAERFDARAQQVLAQDPTSGDPLLIWGYHQLWHGPMSRARINGFSAERPIVVWHRSFHELYMNDGALRWLEIQEQAVRGRPQIDLAKGHFFEAGLGFAIRRLNPYLLAPERYRNGLARLREVTHHGGHTSIGDMATGMFDLETELSAMNQVLETPETPFRIDIVPDARSLLHFREADEVLGFLASLSERNGHRLRFNDHVKLFADGAFFSQLAQMDAPGYIDGHAGEWLTPPETLEAHARLLWNAGYKIHVHVCGDLGVELALTVLEKLQWERPRFNHGFTFEHFGFSHPEQIRRIAALGGNVSANAYYLYELSDMYSREGIGFERASSMVRLASCMGAGITTTVHSDFTMAPAAPLNSAWVAANRINSAGNLMCAAEQLSAEQALQAITLNAAIVLGRDSEVGSIRAGKRADFTVLGADPLREPVETLRDIPIEATVFEGEAFACSRSQFI